MRIGIGTSIVGQQVVSVKEYLSDVGGVPTAAYSVDKVVSTYTDAVVEVRRTVSAVTVEADVAFDGDTITLDSAVTITSGSSSATTLGEFVAASGYTDVDSLGSAQDAFVTTWYDQADNYDLIQSTAANQPKIISAGALVTDEGRPALDSRGGRYMSTTPFTGGQYDCTFCVGKSTGDSGSSQFMHDGNTANNMSVVLYDQTTPDRFRLAAGLFHLVTPSTFNLNTRYLVSTVANNAGTDLIAINGSATTGNAGSNTRNGLYLFANGGADAPSDQWEGFIQEFILYTTDKSALRTAIEGNINGRFNIYT